MKLVLKETYLDSDLKPAEKPTGMGYFTAQLMDVDYNGDRFARVTQRSQNYSDRNPEAYSREQAMGEMIVYMRGVEDGVTASRNSIGCNMDSNAMYLVAKNWTEGGGK